MPRVNGTHYRSAGQGYAAEKAKMGAGPAHEDSKPVEGEHESKGSVLHVKHHGGGKFSTKDEEGNVQKHESVADLNEHMNKHFGLDESSDMEPDNDSDDSDMGDGGDALNSILG